jgi:hypothetical protein
MTGESRAEVIEIPAPATHFSLLRAPDGRLLAADAATHALSLTKWATDAALWMRHPAAGAAQSGFRHHQTGLVLDGDHAASAGARPRTVRAAVGGAATQLVEQHGPSEPPSASLAAMRATGWVCLPALVAPDVLRELEGLAAEEAEGPPSAAGRRQQPPFLRSAALARVAVDPTVMWILREYLGTANVQTAHIPSILTAFPLTDERWTGPQGWHSDFPYLWRTGGERVPEPAGPGAGPDGRVSTPALGVQFNTCIAPFTRANGGTRFVLGSHARNRGPPPTWNLGADVLPDVLAGRAEPPGGRSLAGGGVTGRGVQPYDGPAAQTLECPAGSVILYDARTWHR